MYEPNPSPFEQYRLKHLNGIAMSADLFKMIAEAFEAGQIAEREVIAKMIEDAPPLVKFAQNDKGGCLMCGFTPKLASEIIRARGQG